jgi:hypothetical protein
MFETHHGDAARLNAELDRLRAVSLSDIRDFSGSFLREDNRVLLSYEPRARRAPRSGDAGS